MEKREGPGRPPGQVYPARVCFRMTAKQAEKLRRAAQVAGKTDAQIMRDLIDRLPEAEE